MQEIKYDMIDPVSGLIVNPWIDGVIREIADCENITPMEALKKAHEQVKIKYAVDTKGDLHAMPSEGFLKNASRYFEDYDEAVKASLGIKNAT